MAKKKEITPADLEGLDDETFWKKVKDGVPKTNNNLAERKGKGKRGERGGASRKNNQPVSVRIR